MTWQPIETVPKDGRLAQLEQENTELRRARIADSEIIGRWQCQAEQAEMENAELRRAQARLVKAARLLALETTDDRIDLIQANDCATNAAVVQHWRDEVLAALASPSVVR